MVPLSASRVRWRCRATVRPVVAAAAPPAHARVARAPPSGVVASELGHCVGHVRIVVAIVTVLVKDQAPLDAVVDKLCQPVGLNFIFTIATDAPIVAAVGEHKVKI